MSGYLTTHVLDTARGCPAKGLEIDLFRIKSDARHLIATAVTNDDGRTDKQILPQERLKLENMSSSFMRDPILP